jgi:hypothetical protein
MPVHYLFLEVSKGSGMATSSSEQGPDDAGMRPAEEATTAQKQNKRSDAATTATVVGIVAVGALIFEAALIPGMILGVGAMLVPKVLPRFGESLQPAYRATMRGAYKAGKKARHAFAETKEQVSEVVAGAKSDSATRQL